MDEILVPSLSDVPVPIIDVPAAESDFISADGRYFADAMGLLGSMHAEVHVMIEAGLDMASGENDVHNLHVANTFAHALLDYMRARVESTVLEVSLARSPE